MTWEAYVEGVSSEVSLEKMGKTLSEKLNKGKRAGSVAQLVH
jgi:hypothetical protein